jgi:AcrR family transcriptional regulator
MPTPRLNTDERRAQLTEAALRLIVTHGVGALSVRSLARDQGLSSGALFRHFKTMDEVLEAVVERMVLQISTTFPQPNAPPLQRLTAFVEARSLAVGDGTGFLQLVVSEQFRLALPEAASARLKRLMVRSQRFVLQSVQQGQREGSVRRDLPAADLALLVMGLIQMLALSKKLGLGRRHATATKTLHRLLVAEPPRIKGDMR